MSLFWEEGGSPLTETEPSPEPLTGLTYSDVAERQQERAIPAPEPDPNQPVDYYGSAPGLDWSDLYDVPWQAVKSVGSVGLDVLGTTGRGARTLLSTGDLDRTWDAIVDPSKDVSPTELRQQYLFDDLGSKGGFATDPTTGEWSLKDALGDIGDVVGDVLVGAGTDPLTYILPGVTSLGAARQGATQALVRTMAGERLSPAAKQVAVDAFNVVARPVVPLTVNTISRLEGQTPSLLQRITAGEVGVKLGIPFTSIETGTSALGKALTAAALPIDVAMSALVHSPVGKLLSPAGRAAAKLLEQTKDFFLNPATRTAEAMVGRAAQSAGKQAIEDGVITTYTAFEKFDLTDIPIEKKTLLMNGLGDYHAAKGAIQGGATGVLRAKAGQKTYQEIVDEVEVILVGLTPGQRAKFYELDETLRTTFKEARQRQIASGMQVTETTDALQKQLNTTQDKIAKILKADAEKAGTQPDVFYHAKTKGEFTGGKPSADIGSDADIMGRGFYVSRDPEYAARYGTPEPYNIKGNFANTEQWTSTLQKYDKKPIAGQRKLAREELQAQGYDGVMQEGGNGVIWNQSVLDKPALVKEVTSNAPLLAKLKEKEASLLLRIRESPGYWPLERTEAAEFAAAEARKEAGLATTKSQRDVVNIKRSMLHDDPNLKDVPMTLSEANIAESAIGLERRTPDPPLSKSLKNLFSKEGRAELLDQAEERAMYETDPLKALEKHFRREQQTATSHNLQTSVQNMGGAIDAVFWGKMGSIAREDSVAAGLGRRFSDEAESANVVLDRIRTALMSHSGIKLDDILTVAQQKQMTTRQGLADIFKKGSKPNGYELLNTLDGKNVFIGTPWKQAYDAQLRINQDIPQFMVAVQPLIGTFKAAQTYWWPKYHVRNAISDAFRMFQGRIWDGHTPREILDLMKPALKGQMLNGYKDFKQFAGLRFNLGAEGEKIFGTSVVAGDVFMRKLDADGVLQAGFAAKELDAVGKSLITKEGGRAAPQYLKSVAVMREDAQKVAGMAASMRRNKSYMESQLLVEESLFNYGSISPAAKFLRRTGLAPFISWSAKNIPAQLDYVVMHPGEAALIMRGLNQINSGEMPEHLVYDNLKSKHNIIINKGIDENGRPFANVATESGVIPLSDLSEIMKSPAGYLGEQLGPMFRYWQDYKSGEDASLFKTFIGKPVQMWNKTWKGINDANTDKEGWSIGRVTSGISNQVFSPLVTRKVDIQDEILKSQNRLKKQTDKALWSYRNATNALQEAEATGNTPDSNNPLAAKTWRDLYAQQERWRKAYLNSKSTRDQQDIESRKLLDSIKAMNKTP